MALIKSNIPDDASDLAARHDLTPAERHKAAQADRVASLKAIKQDRTLASASGVFRVLPKMTMTQRHVFWRQEATFGGKTLKLEGHWLLDSFDLRMLLALIAMMSNPHAGHQAGTASHGTTKVGYKELRAAITTKEEEDGQMTLFDSDEVPPAAVARFTKYEMAMLLCGRDDASAYTQIKASLRRLAGISLLVDTPEVEYFANFVSEYRVIKSTGQVIVALHPLVTAAMVSERDYVKMTLDRLMSLETHQGRILYPFLSARVFDGKAQKFRLDDLARHVYADRDDLDDAARMREYRRTLRPALEDIARLPGWKVARADNAGTVFTISRKGSTD